MSRYHPLLVVLHWILAAMTVVGLVMGGKVLSETANSDPQKITLLKIHMSVGMLILVLMIIRLITRFVTAKPQHANTGNTLLNKLGVVMHYLFYLIVILMAVSGMAIASLAGLPEIIFGNSGTALPASFDEYPPRMAHGILSLILTVLITAHVGAFFYHQFILKDKLFSRMWFGPR